MLTSKNLFLLYRKFSTCLIIRHLFHLDKISLLAAWVQINIKLSIKCLEIELLKTIDIATYVHSPKRKSSYSKVKHLTHCE